VNPTFLLLAILSDALAFKKKVNFEVTPRLMLWATALAVATDV
jgi:hypothetical protein